MNDITAIVLASGLSRRMGCNKLLLEIDGRPMITCIFELLKNFDFREVLVVTAYEEISSIAEKFGYRTVFNEAPEIGQSHSVVLGVAASPDSGGWLFLNGDTPGLKVDTLDRILKTAGIYELECRTKIVVPRYDGHSGQPVYFPSRFYGELMSLTGDQGGRQVIRRYSSDVVFIDIEDSDQGMDVDTPEEYRIASGRITESSSI